MAYHGALSGSVEHFHNVKFAEDTSGENRFAPPKPFTPAPGAVIDASLPGPACPQLKDAMPPFFSQIDEVSEDCLNLHIARPANLDISSSSHLPVIVWIHGGGGVKGSNSDSHSDPDKVIELSVADGKPIIYVAITYRLSIFGFARLSVLKDAKSLNVGMRDQRAALEWVRDHIHSFGGDPTRITAGGLSAGGTFISLQTMAYGGEKGAPFQQAWVITQYQSRRTENGMWRTADPDMLAYLRHLSMHELVGSAMEYSIANHPSAGLFTFIPSVDDAADPDISVHYFRLSRILRDVLFTCSSIDFARHMVAHTRIDVDPRFADVGLYALNQSALAPLWKKVGMPYVRVAHGSDTHYIFNGVCPELELGSGDMELSVWFARSLAGFAYTGNPMSISISRSNEQEQEQMFEECPEAFGIGSLMLGGDADHVPHELNIQKIGGPHGTSSVHLVEATDREMDAGTMHHQHVLSAADLDLDLDSVNFALMDSLKMRELKRLLEQEKLGSRCAFIGGLEGVWDV
ncbi:hypothetical protein NHQ30_005338 [Ciborinia camelliae]|nr:hypothetical protein NHQ30_005338 [Ciborinia camelliae]